MEQMAGINVNMRKFYRRSIDIAGFFGFDEGRPKPPYGRNDAIVKAQCLNQC